VVTTGVRERMVKPAVLFAAGFCLWARGEHYLAKRIERITFAWTEGRAIN